MDIILGDFVKLDRERGQISVNIERYIIFAHWQINKTMIKGLMLKFLRRLLC